MSVNAFTEAQYRMGLCYDTKDGVDKYQKEAVKCCRMAAKQGHVAAQDYTNQYYRKKASNWYRKLVWTDWK